MRQRLSNLPRRRVSALAATLAVLALAAGAIAYFTATGTGTAAASVGTINPPGNVTAQQSGADVTVSWSAATLSSAGAVQGYTVTRSDSTTVCGSPTPVTTLSCTDSGVAAGSYTYTVTARFGGFTASATSASITILSAVPITAKPSNPSANTSPSFRFGAPAGGQAYAWGYNLKGQLGNNSTTQSNVPVAVAAGAIPAGTTITQIVAGGNHSLALSSTGQLYAWGNNGNGELGNNSTTDSTVPVAVAAGQVPAGTTITQIAAGGDYSLALSSTGQLYAWGNNGNGQLGNNSNTQSTVPVAVAAGAIPAGTTITQIAAGYGHSIALSSTGQLYAWGDNGNGQLGNGSNTSSSVPVPVSAGAIPAGTTITQIGAGYGHSIALSSTGKLYAWGRNGVGQLGNGSGNDSSVPVAVSAGQVPAGTTITQIAAGGDYSLALSSTGQVYAWGYNSFGQLGNGSNTSSSVPVAVSAGQVPAGTTITQIAAGAYHSLALSSTGQLYAWGYNGNGQLGNNSTTESHVPVAVAAGAIPAGTTIVGLARGSIANHTLALVAAGGGGGPSYQCRLDGGTFSACTSPQAYSGLSDGPHTFTVRAASGGSTGPETSYTWTIDSSAPTITAKPPNPDRSAAPSLSFTHAQSAYTFKCQLDSGGYSACASAQAYSALADGSHTFSVEAVSADGATTTAASYTWSIDTTAPLTTIALSPSSPDGSAGWYTSAPSFTLSASDTGGSGVAATKYQIDSGTTQTYSSAVTVPEGQHTITYWSTDNAGNTETHHTTATINVDETAPTSALSLSGLIWANGGCCTSTPSIGTIGRANIDGTGANQSFINPPNNSTNLQGVAAGASGIYWADAAKGSIGHANLDGSGADDSFIAGVYGTSAVATGATAVYWGENGSGTIGRASLNGTGANSSFITGGSNVQGVTVSGSYIYWANTASNCACNTNQGTIGQAQLDANGNLVPGTVNQSLITGTSSPTALAVSGSYIYWANTADGTIGRAHLDSSGNVVGGSVNESVITGATRPVGLAVDAPYIYWTNTAANTIGRAQLDSNGSGNVVGGTVQQSFITGAANPWGIAALPAATSVSVSGNTLYYNGAAAGSFNLTNTVSDSGSGPASAGFPDISTTGWTHPAETSTNGSGTAPTLSYTSSTFSWSANPSNPTGYTITSSDIAGNTTTTPLSFVDDTTAPTGGALSVNGTTATGAGSTSSATGTGFPIDSRADYTDSQSGLKSSTLTVQSETLTGSTCGTPGSGGPFTTATTITGTTQPSGITAGACYLYTLTGTDNVGNTATVSTTVQVAKATSVSAFGWGVSDGASHLETCTSSCQTGTAGGGAGQLNTPYGVAVDSAGNVFVADYGNQRVDEFSSAGAFVQTFGWGVSDGASHFETCTSSCQTGTAGGGAGQLNNPRGVAVDSAGNVFVADQVNQRVDEFSSAGAFVQTFGWGVSDGATHFETCTSSCHSGTAGGGAGQLNYPTGVAVDSAGNVFVADYGNQRVDEFSSAGAFVQTFGWGVSDGASHFETCTSSCQTGTAGGGAGQLNYPRGVAVDSAGNVFVADQVNQRVDEFSSAGAFVQTFGWGVSDGASHFETCTSSCQTGTGGGGAGQLNYPRGVAVDSAGNVFVADYGNQRVDEFSSAGAFVQTFGWGVSDGASHFETCTSSCQTGTGGGGAGQFSNPVAVALDSTGDVFVADEVNQRVDVLTP